MLQIGMIQDLKILQQLIHFLMFHLLDLVLLLLEYNSIQYLKVHLVI